MNGCEPSDGADLMELATHTLVRPPDDSESYFWRDDHTVLLLRRVGKRAAYRVELADTGSGCVEVAEEFNARWGSRPMGSSGCLFGARRLWPERTYAPPLALLSPDGSRLLWRAVGARYTVRWIAASLTGGADEIARERSAAWARNSHDWAEVVAVNSQGRWTTRSAVMRCVGDPSPLRVARFSIEEGAGGLGADERRLALLVCDWCERMAETGAARLFLVPLDDGEVEPTQQVVPIPPAVGWQVWDAVLSPQGDRIAWITQRGDPCDDWYSLSVSTASGGGWRVVGRTPGVLTKREHLWPTELRWLPDGKRVSFAHMDALWAVPVD